MNYIEINVIVSPNIEENRDKLIAILSAVGYDSFMETDEGLSAYVTENQYDIDILKSTLSDITDFNLSYAEHYIEDQNWNEIWEQNYFKPVIIADKLVIRASFHKDYPIAEQEIIIDPKTAFGTGYHGTTYALMEEILTLDLVGKRVLDMGTGTGILAILSKKNGSNFTLAVDNDPKSVSNSIENITLNNTPDIIVKEGTTLILTNEMFDVIYENIWKNIVIADLPILYRHLETGGVLLTSGFYEHDIPEVRSAAEQLGFIFQNVRIRDGWAVLKFSK